MKNNNYSDFLKILNYLKILHLFFFSIWLCNETKILKLWSFKGWNFEAEQCNRQMSQEEEEEGEEMRHPLAFHAEGKNWLLMV